MSERDNLKNDIQSSLPPTSSLRVTNSWKQFIVEAEGAVKARDFRPKTIRSILLLIDPFLLEDVQLSLYGKFMGAIIGPGFKSGRRYLFLPLFQLFKKKWQHIFKDAPERAIQAYNNLVKALLSEYPSLLLDEHEARGKKTVTEKLLEKGEKSKESLKELIHSKDVQLSKALGFSKLIENWSQEEKRQEIPPELSLQDSLSKELEVLPLSESSKDHLISFFMAQYSLEKKTITSFVKELRDIATPYIQAIGEIIQLVNDPFLLRFKDIIPFVDKATSLQVPSEIFQGSQVDLNASLRKLFEDEAKNHLEKVVFIRSREAKIQSIESKKKILQDKLMPLSKRPDLSDRVMPFLSRLSILNVSYDESSTQEERGKLLTDQKIELIEVDLSQLINEVEAYFGQALRDIVRLDEAVEREVLLFFCRLWDIVSEYTIYPDLLSIDLELKQSLMKGIESASEDVIGGVISWDHFLTKSKELYYSHNVLLHRSEIFVRSRRIKDIRQSLNRELLEIDRLILLIMASNKSNFKERYAPLISARDTLKDRYVEWFYPQKLFSITSDPESINHVFRQGWLFQEEWQSIKSNFKSQLRRDLFPDVASVKSLIRVLERAIARVDFFANNTIKDKSIEAIAEIFLKKLSDWKDEWENNDLPSLQSEGLDALLEVISQFREKTGIELSLLMNVDQNELQDKVISRLYRLKQDADSISELLRDIQYLKTTDVEFEDALLEFVPEIRGAFLSSFSLSAGSFAEEMMRKISDSEIGLRHISNILLMNVGFVDTSSSLERDDLWHKLFLKIEPELERAFSSLFERREAFERISPLIIHHLNLIKSNIANLKNSISVPIQGKNLISSDVTKKLISLFREVSLFFYGTELSSQIDRKKDIQEPISLLDSVWILSWLHSLMLDRFHKEAILSEEEMKEVTDLMMSFRRRLMEILIHNRGASLLQDALDEFITSSEKFIGTYLTESPEAAEVLRDFLRAISLVKSLISKHSGEEKEMRYHRQSFLQPFMYGDLSNLLKR